MRPFTHCLKTALVVLSLLISSGWCATPAANAPRLVQSFAQLPLAFEENQGQAPRDFLYLSRAAGYSVYFSRDGLLVVFDRAKDQATPEVVRIRFAGGKNTGEPAGKDALPGVINYYIGNDPSQWRTGIRQFRTLRYRGVYPGVDAVFYGKRQRLEFDFDLAPGADASRIALRVEGAVARQHQDDLELTTPSGKVAILRKPQLYQDVKGKRRSVAGGFALRSGNEVGFRVGRYERRQALVIDPALTYSTYVDQHLSTRTPLGIAADSSGAVYITGQEETFVSPLSNTPTVTNSAFVIKLDPTGSAQVYETLVGGSQQLGALSEQGKVFAAGYAIALDSTGAAYVAGMTWETDFPITSGAYSSTEFCTVFPPVGDVPPSVGCLEPFAFKLDSTGKVVYSTFLVQPTVDRAGPVPSSIAVDSQGALYVTGATAIQQIGFGPLNVAGLSPTTGAFQTARKTGNNSADFVLKLHPDGSKLDYATYLGGSTSETPGGIAVDTSGVAYVDGGTSSTDFPTTPGAFQTTMSGSSAFFTRLSADGTALVSSTFLGPAGSAGKAIAIDSSNSAYLTGLAGAGFPTTAGAYNTTGLGGFVSKFDSSGNLSYSTDFFGGTFTQFSIFHKPPDAAIAVDNTGAAYVYGFSTTPITLKNAIQTTPSTFVAKLNSTGSDIVYSTFLGAPQGGVLPGGMAVDANQKVYITGQVVDLQDPADTTKDNILVFPAVGTTAGAFQVVSNLPPSEPTAGGALPERMFLMKMAPSRGSAVAVINPRHVIFSPVQRTGVASRPRTVQLSNYGDADLAISNFGIGGTNASDFAISNNTCGATLAVASNCSFLVTYTPTITVGTSSASVNFSFGGSVNPQEIDLTGQAGVPVFQATPSPLDFGSVVGLSGITFLTITNTGTAPMNFLANPFFQGANSNQFAFNAVSGGCVPGSVVLSPLQPGASTTLGLFFCPNGSGPETAQLVFQTDVPGSPQVVQLKGNGVLMAVTASNSSATVSAGQTASYQVTVSTGSTVSGTINVSCTGAPAGATCTASPNTFNLGPSSHQPVMVTVTTTPRSTASRFNPHPGWLWSLALAVGVVLVRPKRRGHRGVLVILALALAGALASCGGGSSGGGGGGGGGTPAGTYTITVNASASAVNSSTSLTLTVQ